MSTGLNNCNFIGRLGQEPDIKYTQQGKAVANLSLAVGETHKDASGKKIEQTEWIRITFFGALAEIAEKYLNKGSQIYVSGKMRTRKWTDNNGQTRYSTEIVGQDMRMLGGKQDNQASASYSQPQQGQVSPQNQAIANELGVDDQIPF